MRRNKSAVALLMVLVLVTMAWAAKSTPLRADFLLNLSPNGFGVSDDGNIAYVNGVQAVRCFFGTNNQNVDLVTYNTGRKLTFTFDPNSPAVQASGLSTIAPTTAEVDLYGVNYYGQFQSMRIGTTAQLQMTIQFKVGSNTYELAYQSLAVKRTSANMWLITYDPVDIGGDPGFTASSQADLSVFRKRSNQTFGAVNMPIRFQVTLQ